MPSIQCSCGRLILVREGQAGTRVPCECGRELMVPSLRLLRAQSLQGEPIPVIVPGENTPLEDANTSALGERQFLIFLTRPHEIPHRISYDAARHFVTACDRLLQRYFEEGGQSWGVDLQISIALLPNGDRLVDVQVRPAIIPPRAVHELADQFRAMPGPPVVNGPVAFTLRKPVGGGASQAPSFDIPFRSLIHHAGELDQLLMEAAGLVPPSTPSVPDRSQHANWWSRLKAWCGPARWRKSRITAVPRAASPLPETPIVSTSVAQQEISAAVALGIDRPSGSLPAAVSRCPSPLPLPGVPANEQRRIPPGGQRLLAADTA